MGSKVTAELARGLAQIDEVDRVIPEASLGDQLAVVQLFDEQVDQAPSQNRNAERVAKGALAILPVLTGAVEAGSAHASVLPDNSIVMSVTPTQSAQPKHEADHHDRDRVEGKVIDKKVDLPADENPYILAEHADRAPGVSVEQEDFQIVALNGLTLETARELPAGTTLKVPEFVEHPQQHNDKHHEGEGVYIVHEGDTDTKIARDHDENLGTLERENHQDDPNLILPGQKLLVHEGKVHTFEFKGVTFKEGELVSEFAAKHGMTYDAAYRKAFITLNPGVDPDHVLAGHTYNLPTSLPIQGRHLRDHNSGEEHHHAAEKPARPRRHGITPPTTYKPKQNHPTEQPQPKRSEAPHHHAAHKEASHKAIEAIKAKGNHEHAHWKNVGEVMEYFIDKGLTPQQAAGVSGNFFVESAGVNPEQHQYDNGPGRGIGQWEIGGRWDALERYADARGVDPYALMTQLDFTWHELTTESYHGLSELRAANSPAQAAVIFEERFEGASVPALQARIDKAEEIYGMYERHYEHAMARSRDRDDRGSQDTMTHNSGHHEFHLSREQTSERITKTALHLSHDKPGHGPYKQDATQAYQSAMTNYDGSKGELPFSDCGVFVATVMRESGMDPDYPVRGTAVQLNYLENSPKYQEFDSIDDTEGGLQPGDILIFSNPGEQEGHTYLYVGEQPNGYNSVSASLYGHVPQPTDAYSEQAGNTFKVFRRVATQETVTTPVTPTQPTPPTPQPPTAETPPAPTPSQPTDPTAEAPTPPPTHWPVYFQSGQPAER